MGFAYKKDEKIMKLEIVKLSTLMRDNRKNLKVFKVHKYKYELRGMEVEIENLPTILCHMRRS